MECAEDDDFQSALDKMVSENIQERMREPVKANNIDISVPVVMKTNMKKSYEQLQVNYKCSTKSVTLKYYNFEVNLPFFDIYLICQNFF